MVKGFQMDYLNTKKGEESTTTDEAPSNPGGSENMSNLNDRSSQGASEDGLAFSQELVDEDTQKDDTSVLHKAILADEETKPEGSDLILIDHSKLIGVLDDTSTFKSKIRLFRDAETNMFKNKYMTLRLRMVKDNVKNE